ncbi:hypothetical protein ACEQ8H_003140 [Pleosporales sp. CAS-2024a]
MSAVPNLPTDKPGLHTNGITNGIKKTPFKLSDKCAENQRPLKVIVIGAGYSGIYCGIRIPEKLRNVDLVIYEKNAGVGGTWYENKYLGCACDIPSHFYQYSFEPNPAWSSLYAPAAEIQAYLERVAKKYSADRFIKLQHEIKDCLWDETVGKWNVKVQNLATGETISEQSDIVISARGGLNIPSWPEIAGFQTFEGEVMHSARWNESYDFKNKRIGVIGSGSSSIQIVPSLQRIAGTHISTFVRSKAWISPSFGHKIEASYGLAGATIPDELRKRLINDPEYLQQFRLAVEEDINGIHAITITGTELQKDTKAEFYQHMKKKLASKPEIFEALVPSFSPGCRRLTPGPGYLEALTQPNVSFIASPIVGISESAVHTADGSTHDIDALVCATGFLTGSPPSFPLTGLNGLSLEEKWADRATTYLSHSVSSFPNFFTMLGPNAAIGSGSLTKLIESVGDFIVKCIRKIQKENIAAMVVKEAREKDFIEIVDAYFKDTVFVDECRSWYKNNETGKMIGLWPGSSLHMMEVLRSPRWEDYTYTYMDELEAREDTNRRLGGKNRVNQLAWLGHGWSLNQLEKRDLAWYLYPEFLEKPTAPKPEENESFKMHPFSH